MATGVIFILIEVVPGDPVAFMMGLSGSTEAADALRIELGLNVGPWARYVDWVWGMVNGNFGISYTYRVPVIELIRETTHSPGPWLRALSELIRETTHGPGPWPQALI